MIVFQTRKKKEGLGTGLARTGTARMYVCSKVKNSQARTGHQRGMGGRKTDDDDTHERHTDTNKLTRHTASGLPHILSGRTHHSGHVPPVAPPSTPRCQETNNSTTTQTGDRGERVRLEQACSASSNLAAGEAGTRPCVGSVRCLWGTTLLRQRAPRSCTVFVMTPPNEHTSEGGRDDRGVPYHAESTLSSAQVLKLRQLETCTLFLIA